MQILIYQSLVSCSGLLNMNTFVKRAKSLQRLALMFWQAGIIICPPLMCDSCLPFNFLAHVLWKFCLLLTDVFGKPYKTLLVLSAVSHEKCFNHWSWKNIFVYFLPYSRSPSASDFLLLLCAVLFSGSLWPELVRKNVHFVTLWLTKLQKKSQVTIYR